MGSSKNYQEWLDADCTLFLPADVAKKKVLSLDDKKMINKYSNNQIKLVRERSRERNIFDAEKMVKKVKEGPFYSNNQIKGKRRSFLFKQPNQIGAGKKVLSIQTTKSNW